MTGGPRRLTLAVAVEKPGDASAARAMEQITAQDRRRRGISDPADQYRHPFGSSMDLLLQSTSGSVPSYCGSRRTGACRSARRSSAT